MKKLIKKWLGIIELENKILHDKKILNMQIKKTITLSKKIREMHTKFKNVNLIIKR